LDYTKSDTYSLNIRRLQEASTLENLKLVPILFQTGYLTIDKWIDDGENFVLRGPNHEVDMALNVYLVQYFTGQDEKYIVSLASEIREALEGGDADGLAAGFSMILRWIPHQQHRATEGFSHAVIFVVLKALHFKVESEVSEEEGTFDIKIFMPPSLVYVGELKYEKFGQLPSEKNQSARRKLLDKALGLAKGRL
jgi:hypothetical protein